MAAAMQPPQPQLLQQPQPARSDPLLFREALAPSGTVLGLAAGRVVDAHARGVAVCYESHVALFREHRDGLERVAVMGENLLALGMAHVPRGPGRVDWLVVVTRDGKYLVFEGGALLFKAYLPPPVSPARLRREPGGLHASVLPLCADTRFFEAQDDGDDGDDDGSGGGGGGGAGDDNDVAMDERRDMSNVVLIGWCVWEASITIVALDVERVERSMAMSQKLEHMVSSLSLFLADRRVGGALVMHPASASWLVSITDRSVASTWMLEGCSSLCAVVPVVSPQDGAESDELSLVLVERSGRLTVALVHENAKMSYELRGRVLRAMLPGDQHGVLVLTEEDGAVPHAPPRNEPWAQPRDVFVISNTEVRSVRVPPLTHWSMYDDEHVVAFDAAAAQVVLLRMDWTRGAALQVLERRALALPEDERAAQRGAPPGVVCAVPVGDSGTLLTASLRDEGASSVLSLLEQGCTWDIVYGGEQSPVLVPPQSATPMLFAVPQDARGSTSAALLFAHPLTQQTQAMDISGDVFGEVTLPFLDHDAFTLALGCVHDGMYVQVIANGIKLGSHDGVVTVWAPPIESRVHVACVLGTHVAVACGDTLFVLRVDVDARAVVGVGSRRIGQQVSALGLGEHDGALLVALGTWVDNKVLVLRADALEHVVAQAELGTRLPRSVLLAQLAPAQPLSLFAGSVDGVLVHFFLHDGRCAQRSAFHIGDTAVQLLRVDKRVLASSTSNAVLHVEPDDALAPTAHRVVCSRLSKAVSFQCCTAVHTPALPHCVAWLDMEGRMGFGGFVELGAFGSRARHLSLVGEATHVVVHSAAHTAYVAVARPPARSPIALGGDGAALDAEEPHALLAVDIHTMSVQWRRPLPGEASGMDLVRYANGDVALALTCNHTARVSDLRQAALSTVMLFALDAHTPQPLQDPMYELEQAVFSSELCAAGNGRVVLATSHHLQVISGHMLASQVLLPTPLPIVEMCTSAGTWLAIAELFGRIHLYRLTGDNAVLVASTDPSSHPMHTCVSMCFVGAAGDSEADVSLLVASHQGYVAVLRVERERAQGVAVLVPAAHANMRTLCNVLVPTHLSVQPLHEDAPGEPPADVLGVCTEGSVVRFSHAINASVFDLLLKVQGLLQDGDDNHAASVVHRGVSSAHAMRQYPALDRCANVDLLSCVLERAELYRLLRRRDPVSVEYLFDHMDPLKYHDMWLLHDMLQE